MEDLWDSIARETPDESPALAAELDRRTAYVASAREKTYSVGAALVTTSDFEPGEFVLGTLPAIRHETSRALIVAGHGRGDR